MVLDIFEKICHRATHGEITFHFFSSTSHGTAWPLHFKFASYAYAFCDLLLTTLSKMFLLESSEVTAGTLGIQHRNRTASCQINKHFKIGMSMQSIEGRIASLKVLPGEHTI